MWRNLAEIDSKAKETPLYRKTSRKDPEEDAVSGMDYDEIISDFVQQMRAKNSSSKSVDPPSSSAKKMTASALAHQERLRQLDKTKQLGVKIPKMGELIDLMQRLAQRGQWMESEQIMFEVLRRSEDGFVRDEIGYDGLLDGYRSAAIFYYHHALIWEAEEMYDRCVAVRERAEWYYSLNPPPMAPLLPIAQYQDELQRLQSLTQQMLQKMHEIIRSLMDAGSHTEAERYLRSALNKLRQMDDDASLFERRMLYMVDLVAILYEMQRVEEAWPIIKEAIDFSTQHLGPIHQYTGLAYSHYGLLLGSQRRLEDAETALQRALSILQQCETASPLMIVQAMISVSDVQVLQFRLSDAEDMLNKAQELHEDTFGRASAQVQARLNEFSTEKGFANLVRNVLSAFSDGRVEEALFGMENVATRVAALFGRDHPESLKIHLHWAKLLLRCESVEGSFERAKDIAEDIVPRMERVFGPTDCDVTMDTCRTLAQSYVRLGRRSAAMRLIQRVVDTQTALLGPGHPLTLDSKYGLFECLFQLGRLDEGQAVLSDFLQHMDGISPEGRDRILAVISPLLAFLKTKESRSEFLIGCAEKLLQNQQLEDAEFIFLEQLRLREEMYLEEAKYRKHPLHHLYLRRNRPLSASSSPARRLRERSDVDDGDGDGDGNGDGDAPCDEAVDGSGGCRDAAGYDASVLSVEEDLAAAVLDGDACAEGDDACRAADSLTSFDTCTSTASRVSDTAKLAASRLVPDSVSIATAQHLARLFRFVGQYADAEFIAQQLVVLREEFWGPWDKRTTDARLFVDFIRSPMSVPSLLVPNEPRPDDADVDAGAAAVAATDATAPAAPLAATSDDDGDARSDDSGDCDGARRPATRAAAAACAPCDRRARPSKAKKVLALLARRGRRVTPIPLTAQQRSLKRMMERRARTLLDTPAAAAARAPNGGCSCLHCLLRRQRRHWAKIFRMFWIPIIYARRVRISLPAYGR